MKNNKTPGIDSFGGRLKYIVLNGLNFCYKKGSLSISMRQTMINRIPKGDKARDKNW